MTNKNHNTGRSIGVFLIVMGLFLAAVKFDVLQLGDIRSYFVWPMILIFFGFVALFKKSVTEGLIMIFIGGYFLIPKLDLYYPQFFDDFYWPVALVLIGLAFIISGIIRKSNRN